MSSRWDTAVLLGLAALTLALILAVIREGRRALDPLTDKIGAALAGPDEEHMGPLAWWYYLRSGGTIGAYEDSVGPAPWWAGGLSWDPLGVTGQGSRWGWWS